VSSDWIQADWPAPGSVVAGTTLRDSRFEIPGQPQLLNQVHGTNVVRAGSPQFASGPPEADAVIAGRSNDVCVVKTADCLPVLLCSTNGLEIGAIHAGWRGLVAGVIEQTIAAMKTPGTELLAWFGPAISQPAFEVGAEVRDAFISAKPAAKSAFVANDRGRWQADLYALARQRLLDLGVSEIYGGGLCTYADQDRFYSYRRDGTAGRLLSFVYRP